MWLSPVITGSLLKKVFEEISGFLVAGVVLQVAFRFKCCSRHAATLVQAFGEFLRRCFLLLIGGPIGDADWLWGLWGMVDRTLMWSRWCPGGILVSASLRTEWPGKFLYLVAVMIFFFSLYKSRDHGPWFLKVFSCLETIYNCIYQGLPTSAMSVLSAYQTTIFLYYLTSSCDLSCMISISAITLRAVVKSLYKALFEWAPMMRDLYF